MAFNPRSGKPPAQILARLLAAGQTLSTVASDVSRMDARVSALERGEGPPP